MFRIRPESGEPIYRQLVRQVTHAITTGSLKPGDKLPTVRQLASDMVINPNTVARAYRELEQAGLTAGGPRKGTFVTFAPPALKLRERRNRVQPYVQNLISEARVLGFSDDDIVQMIERALDASGSGKDV